ncbi:hypothetical protein PWT90_09058 [Aphanocladium album]|nr:hypothetical protein PWT90_09058 [Aphanocladium album]
MKKLVVAGTAAALIGSTQAAAIADPPALWQPEVGQAWQIVIRGPLDMSKPLTPDVPVWDIDAVDNPASTIQALRDAGKKVICYFSAGTWENWRKDKDDFPEEDIGKGLPKWKGEKYVNIRSQAIRDIMTARIQAAHDSGCHAIDPDNLDIYSSDSGFDITPEEAAEYLNFLAAEAKKLGMSTGLKNAPEIVPLVIDSTHFVVNEECANPENENCGEYQPYIASGKPVFQIQYPAGVPNIDDAVVKGNCSRQGTAAGSDSFSTVFKDDLLKGFVEYCDLSKYETAMLEGPDKGEES